MSLPQEKIYQTWGMASAAYLPDDLKWIYIRCGVPLDLLIPCRKDTLDVLLEYYGGNFLL